MSRTKQSVVIIHGGQAFLMSGANKTKFMLAMLRSDKKVDWATFSEHIGPVIDAEDTPENFLDAFVNKV